MSSLFGNVWEWTGSLRERLHPPVLLGTLAYNTNWMARNVELRGGSFLDDMEKIRPYLISGSLVEHDQTKHSDLGFRISAAVRLDSLPLELQQRSKSFRAKGLRGYISKTA